ncbi:MAG: ribonuclease III [Crocinitomicaceae bacterium]|nr:ribonuclease III [Crocinitomicaceae bacterium]MDG1776217.1 ribonuclease III [Crocinitomicaceae bacterium]
MFALFPLFKKKQPKQEVEIARFIMQRFGYRLKKIALFSEALTHKSVSNVNGETSNERLEFLGDSILDSVVAEMLYSKFPNEDEGYLTKVKSKIVSRRTLGVIGHEMGIANVLQYSNSRSIKLETIEGNAFESLIGAIYLDGGYRSVKKSLKHHVFRKYVDLNQILIEEIDFKSRLFIWSQKNRLELEFEIISEVNKGTSWEYLMAVKINGQEYGRGTGSSKKKAEQAAAQETLELVGEL